MSNTTSRPRRPTRRLVYALVVVALLVVAFLAGTRYPHTTETGARCDTTTDHLRCRTDDGRFLPVNQDGVWQDADHVWRSGRPDCLRGSGDDVGPVTLGVVEGSDDGMVWRQVVWVGCP